MDETIDQTPEQTPTPQIKTQEEEIKECKDKYLRLLAEMENMRKRMQKEKQETNRFVVENVIADILTPIDNMENALKFTENLSAEMRNWAQGFTMILGQFKDVLSNNGVVSFTSEGAFFDPHLHYAIETEETDEVPAGTIMKEFVKGYKSGDRTVRPSQVRVAVAPDKNKGVAQESSPQEQSSEKEEN